MVLRKSIRMVDQANYDSGIRIAQVGIEALDLLQQISRQTFSDTFAVSNTAEDMRYYLEHNLSEVRLLEELNTPGVTFYFAYAGHEIAGYLKINEGEAQQEFKSQSCLEIERIYILKAFQGKHIGQHLFDKAIATGIEKGLDFIWLGVWEKNEKAIGFYLKNGFSVFGKHTFMLGSDEQTDLLLKKVLKNMLI